MSPLHTPALRGTEDGCAPWELSSPQFPARDCHRLRSLSSGLRPWVHFAIPLLTIWVLEIQLQLLQFICLKTRCFNNSICFFEEIK